MGDRQRGNKGVRPSAAPAERSIAAASFAYLKVALIPTPARLFELAVPVSHPNAEVSFIAVAVGHKLDAMPVRHPTHEVAVHASPR